MKLRVLLIIGLVFLALSAKELTFSMGESSVAQRISKEVLIKAYGRIGTKPEFFPTSFSNALNLANSGQTDGEVSRIRKINKKFPNLIEVPVPINHIEAVAFSTNGTIQIEKWKDLAPYRLAVVKGVKFIENSARGFNTVYAPTYKEAFDLLQSHQVDILVISKLVGLYNIHLNGYENIKVVSPSLKRLELYHFVHKKNAHLIPLITPVLNAMRDSGEMQYMHNAYLRKILR